MVKTIQLLPDFADLRQIYQVIQNAKERGPVLSVERHIEEDEKQLRMAGEKKEKETDYASQDVGRSKLD